MSFYERKIINNNSNNSLKSSYDKESNSEQKNSVHIILPFELKHFLKKENKNNNNNIKELNENKKKTIKEFLNRQSNYTNKIKENKEKLKNIYNKNNNLNTIKKKIPLSTILTHYYDGINKHYLHKELLYNKYYSNYNTNNTFTQIKSNRIITDIINNIFIKIFKILDSDEDDLISPITITNSIKNIPLKIKKILQNFFDEFQRSNINLKKENFIEIMKDIYNDLEINEKKILIEEFGEKKNKLFKQYSFNGNKINKKSRSMAEKYDNKILLEMKKRNILNKKKNSTQRDFENDKILYFKRYNRTNSSKTIFNPSLNPLNKYTFDKFKNSIV